MREFTATFVVSSESPETLRVAWQRAIEESRQESIHTSVAKAKNLAIVENHRIGDYFTYIQVSAGGPTSFRITFAPRPNADRYWKDLAVKILASLRKSGISIRSEKFA
jgi:hypothetical protein